MMNQLASKKAKKQKRKPRLKKGPDIQDYVVERIDVTRVGYRYFMTRKEARAWAKECMASGASRTRIFHCKFSLISDSKGKRK